MMGLKVWFPFLGDLNQQGCSDVKATNLGAVTSNNNGKIGKCMSFNGSATGALRLPPVLKATDDFSICFWVKFNNLSVNHCLFSQRTAINDLGFTIFWIQGQTGIRLDAGGQTSGGYTRITSTAEWYHVVCCRDKSYKRIYINGELIKEAAYTTTQASNVNSNYAIIGGSQSGSGGSTSDANYLNGYLNDYRIYDHCLSAAEVREISQGLILHYKLDNLGGGFGNPNLCKNSRTFGTGWGGSGAVTQNAFEGFAVKYKDNTSGTGNTDTVVYNNVLTVNPNEVYTASFWAKADTAHNINCFFYNNTSGVVQNSRSVASTGATGTAADGNTVIALTTEWKYYWITWTFASSGTAAAKHLILGRNAKAQSGVSIAKVKIEKGDSATPWAPHPNDGEAITSYIEDSSGYNHNGTITGNITLNSNTPRYSACVNLISGQKISGTGLITSSNPIWTVNFWMKMYSNTYTTWADVISFSGNTPFRLEANNNTGKNLNWWNYPIGTSSGISAASVNYDEWNMMTLVWNGTQIITYKNGVQQASVNISGTAWTPNGNFSIGDTGMYVYMSDLRVYCTALDTDAIRQLYEVGAKVDNKQNLHTFELVENNSKIQITKQGQIKCNELQENEKTKFYQADQIIETNEIIEL